MPVAQCDAEPFRQASLRLDLQRADVKLSAGLSLICIATESLYLRRQAFLHPAELDFLDRLTVPKRIGDYLRGRYAAKCAIAILDTGADPLKQHIGAGVFGQPILLPPNPEGLQISISHSGELGMALAVETGHPMALDIEQLRPDRIHAIKSALTSDEMALACSCDLPHEQALTLLWCMKEALSKVLKCGLTTQFHVLELAEIESENGQLTASFRNFMQYKAIAFVLGGYGCAIALPRKTWGLPVASIRAAF